MITAYFANFWSQRNGSPFSCSDTYFINVELSKAGANEVLWSYLWICASSANMQRICFNLFCLCPIKLVCFALFCHRTSVQRLISVIVWQTQMPKWDTLSEVKINDSMASLNFKRPTVVWLKILYIYSLLRIYVLQQRNHYNCVLSV